MSLFKSLLAMCFAVSSLAASAVISPTASAATDAGDAAQMRALQAQLAETVWELDKPDGGKDHFELHADGSARSYWTTTHGKWWVDSPTSIRLTIGSDPKVISRVHVDLAARKLVWATDQGHIPTGGAARMISSASGAVPPVVAPKPGK